jgi:MtN3 and saliva related transmembrane protein
VNGTNFESTIIIGLLAATCTTLAFLPQVIHTIRRKRTEDISLLMYLAFTIGILLWLVYGLLLRDLPLIIANSITLFLSVIVLFLKIKHG